MKQPLNIDISQSDSAKFVADTWDKWNSARAPQKALWEELRNFVFATDTKSTSTANLGHKNSTTMPKLCQLRDNLHANYMAALFSSNDWLDWVGMDQDSVTKKKAQSIKAYMKNKLEQQNFETIASRLVYDFIDYGNVFGCVDHVNEYVEDIDGSLISGYQGPIGVRISPLDIVFDPTAARFEDSPVVIRKIVSLGQLSKLAETGDFDEDAIKEALSIRHSLGKYGSSDDVDKDSAYRVDGFGSLYDYYTAPNVELLEFRGDFYDVDEQKYYPNHIITVLDRRIIIQYRQNPSWLGKTGVYHAGWRLRPDNLWAMGPLDNLIGMQYRIDHVENAKADAIDEFINPSKKIKGYVEDFDDGPGERIYCGDDGDVDFLRPPIGEILGYDNELLFYQNLMEEMAGAPKQAMGIRTPGEKTAYEVQQLENAAGRIFTNKTSYFEKAFLEPLINGMFEEGRRRLSGIDPARIEDPDFGTVSFLEITREDITAKGKLRPMGARHFAAKAKLVQELTQLMASPIGQDPTVRVHISGKKLAKVMFEDLLGLEDYGIVKDNIAIHEQAETQRTTNVLTEQVQVEDMTPLEEEDAY